MLCDGLPPCFLKYMTYCRNCKFEAKPDYKYLKSLLESTFNDMGYEMDYRWDWTLHKEEVLAEKLKIENEKKEA